MMPNLGGPAGTAAEYWLDAITPDIVEKHIISVLSRAMGIGRTRKPVGIRARRRRDPDPIVPRTASSAERIDSAFDYLASLGAPRSEETNQQ
jgi:hypothetical protein